MEWVESLKHKYYGVDKVPMTSFEKWTMRICGWNHMFYTIMFWWYVVALCRNKNRYVMKYVNKLLSLHRRTIVTKYCIENLNHSYNGNATSSWRPSRFYRKLNGWVKVYLCWVMCSYKAEASPVILVFP